MLSRYFLNKKAKEAGCKLKVPDPENAGWDIYAAESKAILAGEREEVSTGLFLEVAPGFVGLIFARSSLAIKSISVVAGVIDPGYRGELTILLENRGDLNYKVDRGDRIAQVILVKTYNIPPEEVGDKASLRPSNRGDKGFGSTGK